ncbi:MAG TPA: hypothetical protein VE987_18940, partial [Polyangiaceae bacterium]|nr:hypothetical protein [Polyangiaceae bacterium]
MRPIRMFAASAVIALLGSASPPAMADAEFDVNVGKGQVTVTTHSGWHINKDYPWKLVVGDAKLDKSKFNLAETTATLSGAPKGTGKLKGAVC